MELQYQSLESFCLVCHADFGQEETLENIVPDSFPDVSRIVSASGKAFLKTKETSEGMLRLTGTACVTVLYIPEGGLQACALDIEIPFQLSKDFPKIKGGMPLHGSVSVVSADARAINPRKLLIRCSLLCNAAVYGPNRKQLTCDVISDEKAPLEKQLVHYTTHKIFEVVEKDFLFSDVLKQMPSKPPMDELMFYRMEVDTLEGKVIAKKLVCKGSASFVVLYRSGETLVPSRFELPYSQVIELSDEYLEADAELALAMKAVTCRLVDGELEVSVEGVLQSCIWSQLPVTLLSDTYCTSATVSADRERTSLCTLAEMGKRKNQVRQFCPSGIPGKQVLDCHASVVSITEDHGNCNAQFNVDILYLSEDDALCSVNCTAETVCEVSDADQCTRRWNCRPVGEASAVAVTGGLEVRFDAEFGWIQTKNEECSIVCAVNQDNKSDRKPRPSVVIRRVTQNETLWDVAKTCGATVQDICQANGLTSETISGNTMLLIPSKRS